MSVLTTVENRVIIRDQVANMLLEPLRAESVFLAAGPRIFDSSEPLRIPTLTGSTDPSWVREGELIPDWSASFGELALMPSDRASIKALVRLTNELIRQSAIQLEPVLRARLVSDVAFKLDTAMLTGDGSNKSITGLLNQPGTLTGTLDLGNPDSILDALAQLAAHEVTPNRIFLNGQDFFVLRKLKGQDGKYVLQQDITAGEPVHRLFGVPVSVTNKMPAGRAIIADMSCVAVVRDIAPTVAILPERWAEYDETGIRVVTRYDVGLLRPEAVVILTAAAPKP